MEGGLCVLLSVALQMLIFINLFEGGGKARLILKVLNPVSNFQHGVYKDYWENSENDLMVCSSIKKCIVSAWFQNTLISRKKGFGATMLEVGFA